MFNIMCETLVRKVVRALRARWAVLPGLPHDVPW